VKVRDNGPGIAADVLKGLFEPFRSVGKSGGTGLGLAYCQRVMQAFGGEITCPRCWASSPNSPCASRDQRGGARAAPRAAVAQARTVLAGKRLLIVEDDPVQRMATRQKLGPLALTGELDEAADGQPRWSCWRASPTTSCCWTCTCPASTAMRWPRRSAASRANQDVRIVAYTSEPAHLARGKALKAAWTASSASPARSCRCWRLQHVVQQPRGVPSAAGRLAGRRILLADDSAFNRKAVAAYLRNAAAIVIEVEHGRPCWSSCTRRKASTP
jgi:two-component system CAI-1 autoinducer sensor kinase/phosphatase CqsS